MNPFISVKQSVEVALRQVLGAEVVASGYTVELPKDLAHGDMATNAAMVIAPKAGMKPRELAEKIAEALKKDATFTSIEVAGPGFINLKFKAGAWQKLVGGILEEGEKYGSSNIGKGHKVNVEYVSANPTGPMHVGHARGAVVGDALAGIMQKAGFEVTKEYYINDAGSQVEVLARSSLLRYREALGEKIGAIPEGLYPGDYLKPVGAALAQKYGRELTENDLPEIKNFTLSAMMDLIRDDLKSLGVEHEVFFSEKSLSEKNEVDEVLAKLEADNLIYTGVLEPPKGMKPDDWEERPQTLFRATQFGDDVDRPLKKSDGSYTYFASDIAYHLDKMKRGFETLINVWGIDHGGYVKRMNAAVTALSHGKVKLKVLLTQLVNLTENGIPVKMSKRSGTFVTLREVVDEVGKDVVRFIMLTRRNDAPLDFDLAKVKEQSRDNPVFYVQYAHARVNSVLRNAAEVMPEAVEKSKAPAGEILNLLTHPKELAIIRQLAHWPRIVEAAATGFEPHRIAFYLQEVAAEFHGFWNLGKEDVDLKFIVREDERLTTARLALIRAVQVVIASGLTALGVEPVKEMR